MSDLSEQSPDAAPAPVTPGDCLRQERERQGRDVRTIATEMHLSTQAIEAIENNRFAQLGAPVFARGHLRKYASLLGLPPDTVQDLYQKLHDRPVEPDHVPVIHRSTEPSIPMKPDSKSRHGLSKKLSLVIAGAGLVTVAAIAWWYTPVSKAVRTMHPAPIESVAAPTSTGEISVPAATPEVHADPIEPPPTAASAKPAEQGTTIRLRFLFDAESWIEVYDAHGSRRLYDVGQAGQTRTLNVDAPAQVVLGNAGGVIAQVNGQAIELPERRSGQVARFAVSADGTVH